MNGGGVSTQRPDLKIGDRLGPYRLTDLIGEGAMGIVFRAERADGPPVALKILRSEWSTDETYKRRLVHEARAANEVKHKRLVPIVDAGEVDGRHYVAMLFVEGSSLDVRMQVDGPFELDEVVELVTQVGSALDALHRSGMVHRDVKPSNILIDPERGAMLTDFGLAKGRTYSVLTKPGQVMGTLDYLAPELFKGEAAGAASDIYALGCVAYHCLTGAPPFAGRTLFHIGLAHIEEDPADPADDLDVPPQFSWALLSALAKDPERRPPTATTYAHMLRIGARSGRPGGGSASSE